MAGIYVDTSALGRILLDEADAAIIRATLGEYTQGWSSQLLDVELRRLAGREGLTDKVDAILDLATLIQITPARLQRAAQLKPFTVRTLDAIHLEAAISLQRRGRIGAMLTYDQQLQAGCKHHGLTVEAPVVT